MKVRVIEGFEDDFELIEIEASSSDEADLIDRLRNEGVRVVSGNRWKITIASPKLSNLTAFYLNDEQRRLIHNALVQYHVKDGKLSSLLMDLVGGVE